MERTIKENQENKDIERILGINLSAFFDNANLYIIQRKSIIELLNNNSIKRNEFLHRFIELLNKRTNFEWKLKKTIDKEQVETNSYENTTPAISQYTFSYPEVIIEYDYPKKESIYLYSKDLSAQILYAEKKDNNYPGKAKNNKIYDEVTFSNFRKVSFPKFINNIFEETYFEIMSEKKQKIIDKILIEMQNQIDTLKANKMEFVLKLEQKDIKLNSLSDSLRTDQLISLEKEEIIKIKEPKIAVIAKDQIKDMILGNKYKNLNREIKEIINDIKTEKIRSVCFSFTFNDEFREYSGEVELLKDLKRLVELYEEISDYKLSYNNDNRIKEKQYHSTDYNPNIEYFSFRRESSCQLKIESSDGKRITINKLQAKINEIEKILINISKKGIYSLEDLNKALINSLIINKDYVRNIEVYKLLFGNNQKKLINFLNNNNLEINTNSELENAIFEFVNFLNAKITNLKNIIILSKIRKQQVIEKEKEVKLHDSLLKKYAYKLKLKNDIYNLKKEISFIIISIQNIDDKIDYLENKNKELINMTSYNNSDEKESIKQLVKKQ